jgi:hypothetical protein
MVDGETKWQSLPLTRYQVMRKYAAIKRYRSQTEITGRFLYSFARKNELFGTVTDGEQLPLPVVHDGAIQLDARRSEWRGIAPVDIDPAGDNIGRAFQGSADITRVFLARDTHNLYVRVDLRSRISKDVTYGISLRPLDSSTNPPAFLRLTVKPGSYGTVQYASRPMNAQFVWRDNLLQFAVPLDQLHLTASDPNATVDVAADTMFADLFVDRTGFHGMAYNLTAPSPAHVARVETSGASHSYRP